jgi:hypothetical protein
MQIAKIADPGNENTHGAGILPIAEGRITRLEACATRCLPPQKTPAKLDKLIKPNNLTARVLTLPERSPPTTR